MTTASARVERSMTVGEFFAWWEALRDESRYELVAGLPVRLMAPTTIRHVLIQRNAAVALRRELDRAERRCLVLESGPGVALGADGDEYREPDVTVTCARDIDEASRLMPEPFILVEVSSDSTRLADVNDKAAFYARISSVQHYLVVEHDRRRVVHLRRDPNGSLQPRILTDGPVVLDPPGIELALDELYTETELAATA